MTDVEVVGLGVWSESFANWDEFCLAMDGMARDTSAALAPQVIAAKERRRAPKSVKMAVEVMHQACRMAVLEPTGIATVFASAIGDMNITDYMCRTLASAPRTISPTRFHNSVHNAATGYWSIATQSHAAANAVSGFSSSVWIAILDGAIQAVEEQIPVLVVAQELAAPPPLDAIYNMVQPFAMALLLTPVGTCPKPLASMRLGVSAGVVESPPQAQVAGCDWSGNFAARSLPLLEAIGRHNDAELQFPLSASQSLSIAIAPGSQATQSGN
jgi:hypothetical protein